MFRESTSIIVIGRYLENPLNILNISDSVLNINGSSNEEISKIVWRRREVGRSARSGGRGIAVGRLIINN